MNRILIIFFFVSIAALSHAQQQQWAFEMWHEGKIILEKGDTLKGLIKYDLQQDLVQFNAQRGNVEAYAARKVLFFEIFDKTVGQYRQFFSLPYSVNGSYRAPVFFELVEEGKLTLLTRENLEYRSYSSPYYYGSYSRLVIVYKYFLLDEKGNISQFTIKKSELFNMMGRQAQDVEDYMKENKLKIEDRYDLAKIVAYYNSFFKT